MDQFYRTYLDTFVDRSGTHCEKWDACESVFGRADVIPMWVADMDFPTVPAVRDALVNRAMHPIYGYTDNLAAEKQAEIGWLKRRYQMDVQPDWILYSPGVIDSLFFCVRALTKPGDRILIQPPVYGPFFRAVKTFDCTLVKNPLVHTQDGWQMDFDDLERQFAGGVRMMILCNPHNPVGRAWRREELQRLVDLANQYHVIIVCDEIHADFNFGEIPHTRILSLDGSENCVMLTSATKSFNLAGLRQSSIIVKNDELRAKIYAERERAHAGTPNIFGAIAQQTAYTCGDAWMDAVVEYIRENRDYAYDFIRTRIPAIHCDKQSATYLMWLDLRALGGTHTEIQHKLVFDAGVGLNDGTDYGEEGAGWFRLNLATQRAKVQKTLENIENMVRGMGL